MRKRDFRCLPQYESRFTSWKQGRISDINSPGPLYPERCSASGGADFQMKGPYTFFSYVRNRPLQPVSAVFDQLTIVRVFTSTMIQGKGLQAFIAG